MNSFVLSFLFFGFIALVRCNASIDCDFEQGHLCNWSEVSDNDLDWTLNKGSTLTVNTGPSVGKSKNLGITRYFGDRFRS